MIPEILQVLIYKGLCLWVMKIDQFALASHQKIGVFSFKNWYIVYEMLIFLKW